MSPRRTLDAAIAGRPLERRELRVRPNAKDAEDRVLPVSARLAAILELARFDPGGQELPPTLSFSVIEVGGRVTTFVHAW
ncbi:MAG TPA: hypothetical protein VJM31_10455 [Vicinamibacterales bacterium]|nr:hypothetical protein [Vicinamibacterales bacterium]